MVRTVRLDPSSVGRTWGSKRGARGYARSGVSRQEPSKGWNVQGISGRPARQEPSRTGTSYPMELVGPGLIRV
jgi:hypothetical protein